MWHNYLLSAKVPLSVTEGNSGSAILKSQQRSAALNNGFATSVDDLFLSFLYAPDVQQGATRHPQ